MIDCLLGGQALSAVADGRMTVVVGIVNIAVLTWVVVLVGSAGSKFDTSIVSTGYSQTIAGNLLSFFSLCISTSVAWASAVLTFMSASLPPHRNGRHSL